MRNLLWPALLVIGSNLFYHVATKGVSKGVNPFFSLMVTYGIGALFSFALYWVTDKSPGHLLQAAKGLNWASFVLGLAIVGLEAGYIYLYRAGGKISAGPLACNITVSLALLLIGLLFYKEAVTLKQAAGMALCITGLIFING